MGVDATGNFAVVFGVAIPEPKLPDDPAKKRAKKDATDEAEVEEKEYEDEEEQEEEDEDEDEEEEEARQAFNVAHKKVFGSNSKTGLTLSIFSGSESRWDDYRFEKAYVIEYTPSRVLKKSVLRPCPCCVNGQYGCSVCPSGQ